MTSCEIDQDSKFKSDPWKSITKPISIRLKTFPLIHYDNKITKFQHLAQSVKRMAY